MALLNKTTEQKYRNLLKKASSNKYAIPKLYDVIVNTPFENPLLATYISLGIVVLLLVDEDNQTINRVALSNTLHAEGATKTSEKAFHEIKIPTSSKENIIAKVIQTGKPSETADWKDLFTPALKPLSARLNQASAGIAYSLVVPLTIKPGGAMIFSFFKHSEDSNHARNIALYYADLVSQKLNKYHA